MGRVMEMWDEKEWFESGEDGEKELWGFVNLYKSVKGEGSLKGDRRFEVLEVYLC